MFIFFSFHLLCPDELSIQSRLESQQKYQEELEDSVSAKNYSLEEKQSTPRSDALSHRSSSTEKVTRNKTSSGKTGGKSSSKKQTGEDEKLRLLEERRQKLEKENEEKSRRLEELRKQEMLIEEAASKGGVCLVKYQFTVVLLT